MSEPRTETDRAGLSPLKQALLAKRLKAVSAGRAQAQRGLARRPDPGLAPLSYTQEQLWYLREKEGSLSYYANAFRIYGPLDAAALERGVGELVRRHEALRTAFRAVGGRVMQVINPPGPGALRPAEPEGPARGEEELRGLLTREAERPFDLDAESLFRAKLFRLGEADHALLLVLPHIISDRWSVNLLTGELVALYGAFSRGRPSPLPEPTLQFGDYAYWQRRQWEGEAEHESLAFWRGQLAGSPRRLKLPTDHAPGATGAARRGGLQMHRLGRGPSETLRALAARAEATLFVTCLAAFKALLHRFTGECDILVGSGVAGRGRTELEAVVGCFNKFLVYRGRVSPEMDFSRLLGHVRELTLQVYTHQDAPLEKALGGPGQGEGWMSPRRNVGFVLSLPHKESPAEPGGLRLETVRLDGRRAKNELMMRVTDLGQELLLTLEYDADLFDAGTAAWLLGQYVELLGAAAADPRVRLSDLPGRR